MCPSFLKQKLLLDISTVESTEKWNESTDILAGILTGYVDLGFVVFFLLGRGCGLSCAIRLQAL